jgi:hypothetical protein
MEYKNYVVTPNELLEFTIEKELSQKVDGFKIFSSELSEAEKTENIHLCELFDVAFCAVCKLLQIENMRFNVTGGYFYFSVIHSENENHSVESLSPKLSRKRLLKLANHEIAEVVISIFLDRDNWPAEKGISYNLQ